MLVEDGHFKCRGEFPTSLIVSVAGVGTWTGGTDNHYFRIFGAYLVIDEFEAFLKLGGDLFLVSKAQVFQVERLRMACFGTQPAPLGIGGTVGPLDQVERLVGPLLHVLHGNDILGLAAHAPAAIGALAAHAAGQNGQRLHADILTKLEILIITHFHALVVAPGVLDAATGFARTHRGLPAVGIPETVPAAVYHAATGETHELGMQIGQSLSQILAQTMALVGILREKRHHVNIQHTGGE